MKDNVSILPSSLTASLNTFIHGSYVWTVKWNNFSLKKRGLNSALLKDRKSVETLTTECPHDPEQGKRFVQILKRTASRNGAPYAPTLRVKPSYILLWTINVWFLHRGRPPSSSLKRRNVTKSMAVFPLQKWAPVTLHPCQSLKLGVVRRSASR